VVMMICSLFEPLKELLKQKFFCGGIDAALSIND
jgi:hypothetical protein